MSTIVKTYLHIPSQSKSFWVPGDYSADQVKSMYAQEVQGLASMTATTIEEKASPNGTERHVTFTPPSGQKG